MSGFLAFLILGIVSGVIAKMIIPGNNPGGFIVTALLGIAGSYLGGFISSLLGMGKFGELSPMGILWAVAGAVVLLVIYHFVTDKKK